METRGQKTHCTAEITETVANHIRLGNSNRDAALNSGIGQSTFYRWMERGKTEIERVATNPRFNIKKREQPFVNFYHAIKEAMPQRKTILLRRIQQAGQGGEEIVEVREKTEMVGNEMKVVERTTITKHSAPVWQANAWLLERLHPGEFSLRHRVELVDWKSELKELWKTGNLTREDIINELGSDLATEFFISEGIYAGGDGETTAESPIE